MCAVYLYSQSFLKPSYLTRIVDVVNQKDVRLFLIVLFGNRQDIENYCLEYVLFINKYLLITPYEKLVFDGAVCIRMMKLK